MPVNLKTGGVLHCPDCGEAIRVVIGWLDDAINHCFCSCRGGILTPGYTDEEINEMVKRAEEASENENP